MIRYSYLNLEIVKNGINFYDLSQLDWNKFQFKRGIKKYKLTAQDTEKFYIVCEKEYGNILIEDWIYYINKISDPLSLNAGDEIVLPNIEDIKDFLTEQLGVQS